jgi:succinoglycan biosynthesis protein ExoA
VLLPFKPRWAALVVSPYLVGLGLASAAVAAPVQISAVRRNIPIAFLAMHLGWGVGFWEGVAGAVAERRDETR